MLFRKFVIFAIVGASLCIQRCSSGPNDKVITPENFKEMLSSGGGTITTDSSKPPDWNNTIGTTSFIYPEPNGTTNMSFIDVQMNVQTNAHNTTIFQEKFNHSSMCMSMDGSSFSCWPMFRISRFPRFAGVKPGKHTLIATLIDPMTGGFIKNSTSIAKFEYVPINWTEWAIDKAAEEKFWNEYEQVEMMVEDNELHKPWHKRSWRHGKKKKMKKANVIVRRDRQNATEVFLGDSIGFTPWLNASNGTEPVDDLLAEERGFKVATGNKFKKDFENFTVVSEEELLRSNEEPSEPVKQEQFDLSEPMAPPMVVVDHPLENSWVNHTFDVSLQLITSAEINKFRHVFQNAYMCLSLDQATHTCWPIFEETYQPKFSNVRPGRHTLKAAISHPMTGELIPGTGIGTRSFNVRKPPAVERNETEANETGTNSGTCGFCAGGNCGCMPGGCGGNFFSSYSSCGAAPATTKPVADNEFEIYEEETVRIRQKIPKDKMSSRSFKPFKAKDSEPLEEEDIKLRGNGMGGDLDEVLVYIQVDEEKLSLRVSEEDDFQEKAEAFCSKNQILHPTCTSEIIQEIESQFKNSPRIFFTSDP